MSKVCDGLRGHAFIAAQEDGFYNLCEIIEERPRGIEEPSSHMREHGFHSSQYESERLFWHCCSEEPLSRQNGESMEQYASQRRRSWTSLTQTDSEIHLSERHRSDMILDLSGLTREKRLEDLNSQ